MHPGAWRSLTHSFLIYTENTAHYEREIPEKDHFDDPEHSFQFKTDFDAHRCNRNIISILDFPECTYSVRRETCQEVKRVTFKVFILITTEQSSFIPHINTHIAFAWE